VSVCKTVNRLSKARELFPGNFKPIRHRVGKKWFADLNPEAMPSAPSPAIIGVMKAEILQILRELGMTLLAADLIQMLHQSTARFTDFRFPP